MPILPPIGEADDGVPQRDAALNLLRTRRPAIIRDQARAALCVALERVEPTADVCGVAPIPADILPKLVGAVFRDLADARNIRRAGFRNPTRPEAHARPLPSWQLANATAVFARLAVLEGNQ